VTITNTKKDDLDRFVMSNKDKDATEFDQICRNAVVTLNKMTTVFQEGDSLLQGQAQLPVYYWFAKTYADDYADIIRDFLQNFETERAAARAQAVARARTKA
jgi:hypothetical protein